MSASPGEERTKVCGACGERFACCAGHCWCDVVNVSPEVLKVLQQLHTDCICRGCLEAAALSGIKEARSMKTPLIMSWSGGKDCATALWEILRGGEHEVVALLTTVSEEYKRISHHGVRETLLDAQAEAIGIPLEKVYLPSNNSHPCTNAVYEEIMGRVMARYCAQGIRVVGFGDLFLEDLRAWREKNLATMEMRGVFPLWKRDTTRLAKEIIDLGFKAYLSCVEGKVGPGFVGRAFDESLLRDLPADVDPCGEYGEFHSFVYDGPIFQHPVEVRVGQTVIREGRFYADLLPSSVDRSDECATASIPPIGTLKCCSSRSCAS